MIELLKRALEAAFILWGTPRCRRCGARSDGGLALPPPWDDGVCGNCADSSYKPGRTP